MSDNDRARRADDDLEDDFESEVPPAVTFPPEVVTPDAVDDPDRGEYIGAVRAGLTIVPEVTVEPRASDESRTADSRDLAAERDTALADAAATPIEDVDEVSDVELETTDELEPLEADSLGDESLLEPRPAPATASGDRPLGPDPKTHCFERERAGTARERRGGSMERPSSTRHEP